MTPDAPAAPSPLRPGSAWRENIEGILWVLVMFLVARHYIVEVFKIPTGSMAPTLVGEHIRVTCPNCRHVFDADGNAVWNDMLRAMCPNCGRDIENIRRLQGRWRVPVLDPNQGNRVVVNKFAHHFRRPARWSVVVFPQPEQGKNYIKRLVGFPGERVSIHEGDVFINGEIARKPESVQEDIWQPVFDSRNVPKKPIWPDWETTAGTLTRSNAVWRLDPDADGKAALRFARPIAEYAAYNGLKGEAVPDTVTAHFQMNMFSAVGDIRWDTTLRMEAPGEIRLVITDAMDDYAAVIPFGGGTLRILQNDRPLAEQECSLAAAAEHRITFANWDDHLLLRVNGVALFDQDTRPTHRQGRRPMEASGAALEVRGAAATFTSLRLARDIFYVPDPHGPDDSWIIPNNEYFVLGDNSRRSYDSRYWGGFPTNTLVGSASVVLFPVNYMRPLP